MGGEKKGIKEDTWKAGVCKDSILSGNRISLIEPMSVNYFSVWTSNCNEGSSSFLYIIIFDIRHVIGAILQNHFQ